CKRVLGRDPEMGAQGSCWCPRTCCTRPAILYSLDCHKSNEFSAAAKGVVMNRISARGSSFLFAFLLLLLVLVLQCPAAFAQTGSASLHGTVTDPKGSVVPDAEVTLTNEQMGITLTTRTDKAGDYQFKEVRPAIYILT